MSTKHTINPFFKKSKNEQRQILAIVASGVVVFNTLVAALCMLLNVYWMLLFSIPISISIVAPFFDVPTMVKRGKLQYLSPFLLAEKGKDNTITLHGATLFDYVFVLDKNMSGNERTKTIIKGFIQGLIQLIQDYDETKRPTIIKGTSYVLSAKNVNALGFRTVKTSFVQRIVLLYNYLNLMCAISFVKRKITLPKITNIISFEGDLELITKNKDALLHLRDRIKI